MKYKLLGKSGLRVSDLALGTMTFGDDWGFGASREESKKQFDSFAERGGNFLDSAVNYTNGSSEKILGELIAADRAHFVVATKYSLNTRPDDPNTRAATSARTSPMVPAPPGWERTVSFFVIDLSVPGHDPIVDVALGRIAL